MHHLWQSSVRYVLDDMGRVGGAATVAILAGQATLLTTAPTTTSVAEALHSLVLLSCLLFFPVNIYALLLFLYSID